AHPRAVRRDRGDPAGLEGSSEVHRRVTRGARRNPGPCLDLTDRLDRSYPARGRLHLGPVAFYLLSSAEPPDVPNLEVWTLASTGWTRRGATSAAWTGVAPTPARHGGWTSGTPPRSRGSAGSSR